MRSVSVSPEFAALAASLSRTSGGRRNVTIRDFNGWAGFFGLAITASRGRVRGAHASRLEGVQGKAERLPLASGFCITKTHLATPLLHGIRFVQTVLIRFFSYSQLHVQQRSKNAICAHGRTWLQLQLFPVTSENVFFRNLFCDMRRVFHPDRVHLAAVLASGKADLRPPTCVPHAGPCGSVPASRLRPCLTLARGSL